MTLTVPELSLVVLIGPSASGKSTFARAHFKPTEVISSDLCRALVADDENDLSATGDAFEVLHLIAAKRLAAGRLTVVDATNVQIEARKPLVRLAREQHCLLVAIVFDLPERVCQERNQNREDRTIPPRAIRQHIQQLRRSLDGLPSEGFRYVYRFRSPAQVDAATLERQRLWTNLKHEHGPFDIIGDVHGCLDELVALLRLLGYTVGEPETGGSHVFSVSHPGGRRVIFLGDLVDRGPDTTGVLRLVMHMVASGQALCIPGNHDMKLLRKLKGSTVQVTHGLAQSVAQLKEESQEFVQRVIGFLDGLVSHYVLDEGRLVVAHAGMRAELQGRASRRVRDFALYGETTGETDEFGLPVRADWAQEYRGPATVVYGHTPVVEPVWVNRTINIDTGCVFGGRLTALRYPERELLSVPAARTYYQALRPHTQTTAGGVGLARQRDELLNIDDIAGKRLIPTRLHHTVTIREDQAAAALEIMSRFAIDPRWLIYLPPTMAPTETSALPDLLEHPAEAFAYYRTNGVPQVICEEKHMGSRAVVIACRTGEAARERFGVPDGEVGVCYTRTGRRFFSDPALEAAFLMRIRRALDSAGIWDELGTDWACLDCELTPWSAKAEALLREQYAAVGAAGQASLRAVALRLEQARERGTDVAVLAQHYRDRAALTMRYVETYRRYCWPVNSVEDLRLAPFHLLATEGHVHADRDHAWHMETIARICAADARADGQTAVLTATPHLTVDVTDASSQEEAVRQWDNITARGGEGIVVKPLPFVARGRRGLLQPAVKCRGREYLRIIYGPEYTMPEQLERLRPRGLGTKRSLALREFALGIEALERFVRGEPLYSVHECVFGVLALESEPVDPRL